MTDQDYAEAHARAFNVAAAMPVTFHQEAQALLDLALETGASFRATEPALRRLCALRGRPEGIAISGFPTFSLSIAS